MYDVEKIKKEIRNLKMPKEYWRINLEKWDANDFYMMMSIRKDAGKTTQSLLLGLVLFKLYGKTTEYLRCDEEQLVRASVSTLYDVILKHGYVPKLFKDYNTIIYKSQLKKFYLAYLDEEGNIQKTHPEPLCACHSLENWQKYKSSYNNPNGDYIVFDEFSDSKRITNMQMVELQNNISTIGRDRVDVRVMMLGNNTNQYCFWFSEFCIEDDIPGLKFGGYIEKKTELGTTLYVSMLELSDEKKQDLLKRKIRFSGFNTPKMNAFNGVDVWQGNSHPHIPDVEMLNGEYQINERIYIKHRNKYVKIHTYYSEEAGYYCFLHYSNEPKLKDNVVLTLDPLTTQEIYGYGKFAPNKIREKIFTVISLKTQNRWFYASNSVGELIQDYFNEIV